MKTYAVRFRDQNEVPAIVFAAADNPDGAVARALDMVNKRADSLQFARNVEHLKIEHNWTCDAPPVLIPEEHVPEFIKSMVEKLK